MRFSLHFDTVIRSSLGTSRSRDLQRRALLMTIILYLLAPTITAAQTRYWSRTLEDGNASLRGIDCADSQTCMCIGMASLYGESHVLKSTDAGMTWNVAFSANADTLKRAIPWFHDIAYSSPQVALVAADSGQIYRTSDGGFTWVVDTPLVTTLPIRRISMFDDRHGVFLTDGGTTWTFNDTALPDVVGRPQTGYKFPWFYGSSFINQNDGWFFAMLAPDYAGLQSRAIMMRTSDGGLHWHILVDGGGIMDNGMYRIQFRDSLEGIATAPYHMLRTRDGGYTWVPDSVRNDPPVYLPRRSANMSVGAGASKWLYRFVDAPIVHVSERTEHVGSGITATTVGDLLVVQSSANDCKTRTSEIYSTLGQQIRRISVTSTTGSYSIDIGGLPKGGYLLVEGSCDRSSTLRFMIK